MGEDVVADSLPSKKATLAELVKLTRAAGAPLPSNEIPTGLYNALLHHFGGIQRARRAAKLPDPPQYREWSQASAVAEVRRLHQDGLTIRFRDLELCGREDLVGAIRVYVGSIIRARVLAGVPHPPRRWFEQERWDEDRVVEEILELHELGKPLAYSKAPNKLVNAGVRYFESWDAAITAAGLDCDAIRLRRKPYDDEQMLERIRALAREYPRMNFGELYRHPDGQALMRRFSSIEEAVERAGVTGWPIRVMHDAYSEEEVIRALKVRHRAGKRLAKIAIEVEDTRLRLGIVRHFGTMEAGLTAAGLESELPDTIRWSREEVLRQLEIRRAKGLPLHASAVRKDMSSLYAAAIQHFGNYMAAARRFGAKPRKVNWTQEAALAALRKLGRKHDVLKCTDVPSGLFRASKRFWGTWEDVCRAAGIDGLDHVPRGHWTRERIIEELRDRAANGQPVSGKLIGMPLLSACWRNFGGLDQALAAANVNR